MRQIVSKGFVGFDGGSKGAITMVKPRRDDDQYVETPQPCNLDRNAIITVKFHTATMSLCPDQGIDSFSGMDGTFILYPWFIDDLSRWSIGPARGADPDHPEKVVPVGTVTYSDSGDIGNISFTSVCVEGDWIFSAEVQGSDGVSFFCWAFVGGMVHPVIPSALTLGANGCCFSSSDPTCVPVVPEFAYGVFTGGTGTASQ